MKLSHRIISRIRRLHWKEIIIDGAILVFALSILTVAGVFVWISTLDIPDLSAFEERRVLQSTKIYDRTGEIVLYDLGQDVRRTIVPFNEISHYLKNASIAIEDDQFYNHHGIRPRAILRAGLANFSQGDLLGGQGGSTITQQVIKNSVLQSEKTLTRKIKEAILAVKIERVLTKDEILSIYLNESPYGGTIYGVEEAAQAFFAKKASEVTLGEAAYLAALPQAPTYLSPYGSHREALDSRQKLVLERMKINGFITDEEYNEAVSTTTEFQPQAVTGIRAPHFVMFIREQLVEKFGEEALTGRGLRVITTLDWELQKEAERIVAEKGEINIDRFKANNAGLVATDPKTGDLLVMVGSRDYFAEDIDGNFNIATAERQPGSAIKPFAYAAAFSKGYLPNTIVYDVRTQFSPNCPPDSTSSESPCYSPNNYNNKFLGPISLRNALAQSLNIPAVKVLYLAGVRDTLKLAADMGLTTLNDPERYGLTLVLGGGEVKLVDMTYAYGVFGNEGVKAKPRSILRIEDNRGLVIEETQIESSRVMDRNVTLMISDVLSDNVARTPLWGANSLVNFPGKAVASKTGSTNNLRDAWLMGYSPSIAVGIWVGNNDNKPMGGGLSGLIVTPMWREFMDIALKKLDPENKDTFAQPEINLTGVKPIIAGQYVNLSTLQESLAASGNDNLDLSLIYDNIHSILHYVNKNDPHGPYPTNPGNDSHYENWEWAVQAWKVATFGEMKPPEVTPEEEPAAEEEEEDPPRRNRRNNND
ncbi:transglycosylase domain-containing protein [Patescibacteria group bacterium]|nr:transglycosylase domain-containing protein [Patescibacteria group bacterium]